MSALRERVLAATAAFRPKAVECAALGGTVWVRPLSVRGMALVSAAQSDDAKKHRVPILILMDCVCDEFGARAFSEADEDILNNLPGMGIDAVINEITTMNDGVGKSTPVGN